MLGSAQRLLAVVGTPVAAILAIGIVAEVVNLWRVEQTYHFSYVEAWHAVSLIDRWVLIGLGVKYLSYALPIALVLLLLLLGLFYLIRRFRSSRPPAASVVRDNHTVGWIQTSTSPGSDAQGTGTIWWTQASTSPGENTPGTSAWWVALIINSWVVLIVVATALVLIWLPYRALKSPESDEVLRYLPHVEMTIAGDSTDATDSTESSSQPFTGVAEPVEEGSQNRYTVTGSIESADAGPQDEPAVGSEELIGVLLSHSSDYWYILSQGDYHKGEIVAVPLDKASEIRVTP